MYTLQSPPTYPECDSRDLRKTLSAVADLEPVTIFHEPINIRAENVERINAHAASLGVSLRTEVFSTRIQWQDYAIQSLKIVEELATELGVEDRLHLWPDKSLGNLTLVNRMPQPRVYLDWLRTCWKRVSDWPQ